MIEGFEGLKALVVGDVMIDAYTKGVVERMSPEAPVPIVSVQSRFRRLGGAANVALNLQSLGAIPMVCAVIGDDLHADWMLRMMEEEGLDTSCMMRSEARVTTVKHRVFDGDRQVLRIDEEDTFDLNNEEQSYLFRLIERQLSRQPFDVIVLQDYNKGVLTEWMIQSVIRLARDKGIPVAVDPKKRNFLAYEGATLFKPNAKELREGLGVTAETLDELRQAMRSLQTRLGCEYLMVTLSEQGVMISHGQEFHHLAAFPRNIVDVSGAGDTVLSVAALCMALHQDAKTIAHLSNLAGGLVCETLGVTPIHKERLAQEIALHREP